MELQKNNTEKVYIYLVKISVLIGILAYISAGGLARILLCFVFIPHFFIFYFINKKSNKYLNSINKILIVLSCISFMVFQFFFVDGGDTTSSLTSVFGLLRGEETSICHNFYMFALYSQIIISIIQIIYNSVLKHKKNTSESNDNEEQFEYSVPQESKYNDTKEQFDYSTSQESDSKDSETMLKIFWGIIIVFIIVAILKIL